VLTVCNTVKCYVMCRNANCLDRAVSVWVGNFGCATFRFNPEGREISGTLVWAESAEGHYSLCAQFEDSAVSHSMYEQTEMFKKGQTCDRFRVHGTLL